TVGTGVVSVALMAALVAALEMAAENGGPAGFNRSHHAALRDRHRRAVLKTIGGTVAAEHVRHFELGAIHGPALRSAGVQPAWDRGRLAAVADRGDWWQHTPWW